MTNFDRYGYVHPDLLVTDVGRLTLAGVRRSPLTIQSARGHAESCRRDANPILYPTGRSGGPIVSLEPEIDTVGSCPARADSG